MRYRWCQIGELLAFLLPNPAAAVTGNYILCREITSVWRRFELSLEKGQKNQDWTGGKKEVRVVFSEVQDFGEESKTAAAVFVVVTVVFINMQQDRSCQSYLLPFPVAHPALPWLGKRCRPLPGCWQLPPFQHPPLPLDSSCQAQAGCRRAGCSSCEIGLWPESRGIIET